MIRREVLNDGRVWLEQDLELAAGRAKRDVAEQAAHVRAEADAVAAKLDAGRRWWDTAWAEWSPAS